MGIESVLFLLFVVLNMSHESLGQSAGCTTALIRLSPCLNYISGSSSTPPSSCCSRLANLVQSQPLCLCSALNGGAAASLGVTINQTRALALPGACDVQTPPASRCNDTIEPAAPAISPASSPESLPPESSDDEEPAETPTATTWEASFPSATAGSTTKSVPTTGGIPSSGRSLINQTHFYHIRVGVLLTALLSLMH